MSKFVPGSTGGDNFFLKFVDQRETYGEHVIEEFLRCIKYSGFKKWFNDASKESQINKLEAQPQSFVRKLDDLARKDSDFYYKETKKIIVDLGAGSGRDLCIAENILQNSEKYAIDSAEKIRPYGIKNIILDLEKEELPFTSKKIDIFIANQVLEHTKELFWIFHEVTRCLKLGGHFIIGVPNIASFHNRLLLLLGKHPTQFKSYSAHIRPFSKDDLTKFVEVCFPGGYKLVSFAGSQFYPFPPKISRIFCKLFPNAAFSAFFLFQKVGEYDRQFLDHVKHAKLETPFFLGDDKESI